MATTPIAQVQFATRLPADLHHKLKKHCVDERTTLQEFLVGLLEKALKGKK